MLNWMSINKLNEADIIFAFLIPVLNKIKNEYGVQCLEWDNI